MSDASVSWWFVAFGVDACLVLEDFPSDFFFTELNQLVMIHFPCLVR